MLALLSVAADVRAQTLDAFDPGADGTVDAMAIQPDNRILVGGSFSNIGGGGSGATSRLRLARLHADASVDASFDPQGSLVGSGGDGVRAIAVLPNGKILVGGAGGFAGGRGIVRLNSNGSLDPTFTTATNNSVLAIALQPDGKILVGGSFTTLNGAPRNRIARLHADGTLDTTFDPGASQTVFTLALQQDGRILAGGSFDSIGGGGTGTTSRAGIARLSANGTVDPTFNPGLASNQVPVVRAITIQPDGRILIGGGFSSVSGTARHNIARLTASGSLDSAFAPPLGTVSDVYSVRSIAVLPNRKVVLGGMFSLAPAALTHLARLNSNGSADTTFQRDTNALVNVVAVDLAGRVMVGGNFGTVAGSVRNRLARLDLSTRLLAQLVGPGSGPNFDAWFVAISGDGNTAMVSDPHDNNSRGGVWVWVRDQFGAWAEQQKLDPQFFSYPSEMRLALSNNGNTAIIGRGNTSSPEAAIWIRDSGWHRVTTLFPSDATVEGSSEVSVALSADGNTAIVGARRDNDSKGAAWIFVRNGVGAWVQQGPKLVGDAALGWQFSGQGTAVALTADGNMAVVAGDGASGGIWIWARNAGVWTQQGQKLFPNAAIQSVSVSADGNTLVAGIPLDNNNVGAVWVMTRNGSLWTAQQKLVAADAVTGQFEAPLQGNVVSLSADGNTVIVGGHGDNGYRGAAWIWSKKGGVWTQEPKLAGSGTNGHFGRSVGISGADGTVVIGDLSFAYSPPWVSSRPGVVTFAASNVTRNSATLVGRFYSNGTLTTGMFEYGLSATYGSSIWLNEEGQGWKSMWSDNQSWGWRLPSETVSRMVADLACGTTYHFRAVASAGNTNTSAADRTFTTASCGPSVTTLPASSISATSATLNATVNPDGVATTLYFDYGLDLSYGTTVVAGDVGSGTTAVSRNVAANGLSCGTTYHYRARAQNTAGTVPGANQTFTTAPCAPTIGTTTPGNAQITIAFTAGADGGVPITNYKYSTDGGATWIARSPAQTASPLVITGLLNGTTHSVQVRALNAIGDGAPSVPATATPFTIPSAPAMTVGAGNRQLTISFTPGANGGAAITNYKYSLDGGASWVTRTPASTASPLVISNLSNGTSYFVRLRAINAAGDGDPSGTVTATLGITPAAPTITVTPGNGQLTIAFTPGSDGGSAITNYEYSTNSGGTWTPRSPAATTSPFVIGGLINGTAYQVQLRAVNAIGNGAPSEPWPATPSTTPAAPVITGLRPGNAQLTVFFTPGDNGGADITNYEYFVDGVWTRRDPVAATSPLVIPKLTNGRTYEVRLRAVNTHGVGAASAPGSAVPQLSADETVDSSFNPGADAGIRTIAIQPDHSMFVGGSFTTVGEGTDATTRHLVARLQSNGLVDTTFNAGSPDDPEPNVGRGSYVTAVAVQRDRKVLITSGEDSPPPTERRHITRLDESGRRDQQFDYIAADRPIYALVVQKEQNATDDQILVAGSFMTLGRLTERADRSRIGRITLQGTVDKTFDPGADGDVTALVVHQNRILVGGAFTTIGGGGSGIVTRHQIARLEKNGSVDTSFDPGLWSQPSAIVKAIAVQGDGKILIGGRFITRGDGDAGGITRHNIARLNEDGSIDRTFNPGSPGLSAALPIVESILVLPNGKILVGGQSVAVGIADGIPRHLIRLHSDGSLDIDFDPNPNGRVSALVQQADGKILVGGDFTMMGGVPRNRLARFRPLGTVIGAPPIPAPFSEPIEPGKTVLKALHIVELRDRINSLRLRFNLAQRAWTHPELRGVTANVTHIRELRDAVLGAYDAALVAGFRVTRPVFADDPLTPQQSSIRAKHIEQLRTAVHELEGL